MTDIFDILGPIMVGPSSSHTAGAVRIGQIARILLEEKPVRVKLYLHGSFAETGVGHGTDKALIAGLLGMATDDLNIAKSFSIAEEQGLTFQFGRADLHDAHPNSVLLEMEGQSGKTMSVQASSTGGGRILVTKIDKIDLSLTGDYNTLIVRNRDNRGCIADVTSVLSQAEVNVANMNLRRTVKGGDAIMIIETDEKIGKEVVEKMRTLPGIQSAIYYEKGE